MFAIFLGVTTLTLPTDKKETFQKAFSLVAELMRELVRLVLHVAPVGVGALAAATVGKYGNSVFGPLAKFVGTVWLAQLMMVVFYMIVILFVARRSPLQWLKTTGPLYATTAATCSSLASLVVSISIAEERLRIPEKDLQFHVAARRPAE